MKQMRLYGKTIREFEEITKQAYREEAKKSSQTEF